VIGAGGVRRLDDDHVEGLEAPNEDLVGAEAVHRRFRAWLVALGHEAYR
jgi:hypothetical protein